MFMFWRPASEVYRPPEGTELKNVPPNPNYRRWGYSVAMLKDGQGEDLPPRGNTAIFRIFKNGMTEPVHVSKPEHRACFNVDVLAGSGILIRAWAAGGVQKSEMKPGIQVDITPGQSYSYVNTGREDLVLHDVATPAWHPEDEIKLIELKSRKHKQRLGDEGYPTVLRPDGRELVISSSFYDAIFEAAAGRFAA